MKTFYLFIIIPVLYVSCSGSIPENYTEVSDTVKIYPDYSDVAIPYNIAPLNFLIDTEADDYITCISGALGDPLLYKGRKVQIKADKWRRLLEENKGADIFIQVYLNKKGKWSKYPVIKNRVVEDTVDEYLSYRIISPGYSFSEKIYIKQRNLTNFTETDIYNNRVIVENQDRQCINCHSFQNYRTDNMQFHTRWIHSGTVIVSDGEIKKVNMKVDGLLSGAVYPAWHPKEKLIAYSVNNIVQRFYSKDIQKVEVQDTESYLILYDINANKVSIIQNDSNSLETFPSWSPDGKMLYFVSAHFSAAKAEREAVAEAEYDKIKYNIMRMPFDPETKTFGEPDTVFNASAINKSATLARISPDGKYLLFTMGDYGTFHIWHSSSDLHLIDLQTGEERKLENVNSPNVESYHTWSSNGRWIVFSSRRDDGSYTRPYIAYFDKNGKAHKPFILPQKDPDFYEQFFYSYNIPEFMVEPVKISVREFVDAIKKDPIQAQD